MRDWRVDREKEYFFKDFRRVISKIRLDEEGQTNRTFERSLVQLIYFSQDFRIKFILRAVKKFFFFFLNYTINFYFRRIDIVYNKTWIKGTKQYKSICVCVTIFYISAGLDWWNRSRVVKKTYLTTLIG